MTTLFLDKLLHVVAADCEKSVKTIGFVKGI